MTNFDIQSLVNFDALVKTREHLHMNPEISFQEFETAKFIRQKLDGFGLSWEPMCETGTVVVINPENADKGCIALRGDIDALPILEQNDVPYKSKNEGLMHACGHDVHTTILLGVAEILSKNLDKVDQCIKLIFQLGEEKLPGGASLMIKEGVLENPRVDKIIGLHVFPDLETGKVGFREGMYMASCDELHVTVKGVGGHGALPQKIKDPVIATCELLTSLQRVVSRNCLPTIPSVLSFGRIEALGATNVIPSEVKIQGTFRTLNETWRKQAHELIIETKKGIELAHQVEIDFDIQVGYPYLENHPATTKEVKERAIAQLGADKVVDLPIRMTAEDFSYYSQEVPACFFRLGTRNEAKGFIHGVHHPQFDIDKNALLTGIETMLAAINFKK